MIQVFDTAAAGIALARRKLGCPDCGRPDCGRPLRPWGHARERTVRDLGGALVTVRPDRALCDGCKATHVVLDAALLPRRAYAVGLIGRALAAAALGPGHRRIARDIAVPAGTVRLDPRRPPLRRPAARHSHPRRRGTRPGRAAGPAPPRRDGVGTGPACALATLAAAAVRTGHSGRPG